jgi:glycosidase
MFVYAHHILCRNNIIFLGFSSGSPWLPLNPDFPNVNVNAQLTTTDNSHIKIYRTLSKLRQQPSILFGSFNTIVCNGTVFAYSRVKKGNPGYVVAVNLGEEVTGIDLSSFPMLPESGLVEARSHHDRNDKAKEVEMDNNEEALG